MATKRDYYEVLGVERTASVSDMRSAYRKLAAKYHPDVNPGDHTAEEKFKELNEAHEVLSSPEKRQVYDQFGHDGPQGGAGGAGFGDIFDMFFGAGGGFQSRRGAGNAERARQQATLGADLRYDLEITLEEAAFGVDKTLKLSRLEPCETCRGNGAKPGTSPETCPTCSGSGQVRHVQNTILGSFATVTPVYALQRARGSCDCRPVPHMPGPGTAASDARAHAACAWRAWIRASGWWMPGRAMQACAAGSAATCMWSFMSSRTRSSRAGGRMLSTKRR